jgi:hypothetical protein
VISLLIYDSIRFWLHPHHLPLGTYTCPPHLPTSIPITYFIDKEPKRITVTKKVFAIGHFCKKNGHIINFPGDAPFTFLHKAYFNIAFFIMAYQLRFFIKFVTMNLKTTLISAGAGLTLLAAYFLLSKKYRHQKKQGKLKPDTTPINTPVQSIAG